jgi:hypothetical protein
MILICLSQYIYSNLWVKITYQISYMQNFGEFKMWLAAENGMFLRQNGEEWIVTNTEHLEIGCSDSVKVHFHLESVLLQFCVYSSNIC